MSQYRRPGPCKMCGSGLTMLEFVNQDRVDWLDGRIEFVGGNMIVVCNACSYRELAEKEQK